MMWCLIALNAIVFWIEIRLPEARLASFIERGGLVPERLLHDWSHSWALLTSMFLHGGWMHIIGNMWFLYLFGDNVEDRMGPLRFLAFYLLCGVAAALTHVLLHADSKVPVIGASGAISGVMGAYFILFPKSRVITLIVILLIIRLVEIPAQVYLGLWFVLQLLSGFVSLGAADGFSSVAWWAHIGGFVAGMVLMPVFVRRRQPSRRSYPDEYRPW